MAQLWLGFARRKNGGGLANSEQVNAPALLAKVLESDNVRILVDGVPVLLFIVSIYMCKSDFM